MYNVIMIRNKIKELLEKHYSRFMVDSILVGRRKPNIEVISEAQIDLKVPVIAWVDIKKYLKNIEGV